MNKVILGKYVKIRTGKLDANASEENGKYPFFTCAREISRINTYAFDCECVLVAGNGELNIKYYEGKFNAYQRTYVIESLDKQILSTKYLYYFIDSYIDKLRNGAIGGVIKYIKLNHLTDIELPLPDLETQDKIVAILNKAKNLIEKRENTIALFDKLLRATFLDMFGDPVFNKKELIEIKLFEVIKKIDAGWSPVCEEKQRSNSNQFAVLKLGAISKRFFDERQNKLLPENLPIKKNIQAKKGNLLFSRKNTKELVGSTVYIFNEFENLLLPDTIFNLRYDQSKVSGVYLYYLFNDKNFRKTIQDLSSGAAASMSNISQEKLLNHTILLPDIELQLQFENIVLKIYENSLDKINKSKALLENLLNSLSQQAFSGKILYDIDVELEALVNTIDLKKEDEENDINTIKNDVTFLQRLLDKLNEQEFEDIEQYDKAKYIVFRVMKEEENLIKQNFDTDKQRIKLTV